MMLQVASDQNPLVREFLIQTMDPDERPLEADMSLGDMLADLDREDE